MKLGEAFIELGINPQGFNKGLNQALGQIMVLEQGIKSVGRVFQQLAGETMDYVAHLDKIQKLSGINADKFQEWETRAKLAGVEVSALESSLKNLSSFNAQKTQMMFGINPNTDAFAKLEQIIKRADKIKNAGVRNEYLGKLGVSPEMVLLMHQSADELERFKKLQLTKEDRDNVMELNHSWRLLKLEMSGMWKKIISSDTLTKPLINTFENLREMGNEFADALGGWENVAKILLVAGGVLAAIKAPLLAVFGMGIMLINEAKAVLSGNPNSVANDIVQSAKYKKAKDDIDSFEAELKHAEDFWGKDSKHAQKRRAQLEQAKINLNEVIVTDLRSRTFGSGKTNEEIGQDKLDDFHYKMMQYGLVNFDEKTGGLSYSAKDRRYVGYSNLMGIIKKHEATNPTNNNVSVTQNITIPADLKNPQEFLDNMYKAAEENLSNALSSTIMQINSPNI